MWTIDVKVHGVLHKLETCAESATHLMPALERFGKYWYTRTAETYKAQAFAPLAESTLAKRAARGLQSMQTKLRADVRRATKRAQKAGGDRRGLLDKFLGSRDLASAALGMNRGVQNRLAVLAEFHRQHGERGPRGEREGRAISSKALSLKQQESLSARTMRAVSRAVGAPILGGLDKSIYIDEHEDSVTLTSSTRGKWSAVHNEGGTAGHGSKEPERETISIESEDLEVLKSILKSHLLMAFDEGRHGPGF